MPETRSRLDTSIPETRFLTLKQSSNLQKTLEKINRESMSEQVCTGTISLECKPKPPPPPPPPPPKKKPESPFVILLAFLVLLILTGIGGGAYTASSSDAICAPHDDCNEPEFRPHKRILKHGSRGADVKKLQKLLNARGLSPHPIVVDGVFGPTTLTAVKKFQRQNHLHVDGVVGGKTWDRLFASS
ncbi:peptidoglycan-binding domain-containing protein [Microcoleus sp. N3A4]|uniref:peptidoglycan-binding domain-containing protein n=1 Tax=Microcoleus sp. N3A4 TaxID=3055379 RepID=UPI002FD13EE2